MLYYSAGFRKQYKKLPKKLREEVLHRLELLLADEWSDVLNNHKLSGRFADCRSINITGDVRLVYKHITGGYYLIAVGSHSKLYE